MPLDANEILRRARALNDAKDAKPQATVKNNSVAQTSSSIESLTRPVTPSYTETPVLPAQEILNRALNVADPQLHESLEATPTPIPSAQEILNRALNVADPQLHESLEATPTPIPSAQEILNRALNVADPQPDEDLEATPAPVPSAQALLERMRNVVADAPTPDSHYQEHALPDESLSEDPDDYAKKLQNDWDEIVQSYSLDISEAFYQEHQDILLNGYVTQHIKLLKDMMQQHDPEYDAQMALCFFIFQQLNPFKDLGHDELNSMNTIQDMDNCNALHQFGQELSYCSDSEEIQNKIDTLDPTDPVLNLKTALGIYAQKYGVPYIYDNEATPEGYTPATFVPDDTPQSFGVQSPIESSDHSPQLEAHSDQTPKFKSAIKSTPNVKTKKLNYLEEQLSNITTFFKAADCDHSYQNELKQELLKYEQINNIKTFYQVIGAHLGRSSPKVAEYFGCKPAYLLQEFLKKPGLSREAEQFLAKYPKFDITTVQDAILHGSLTTQDREDLIQKHNLEEDMVNEFMKSLTGSSLISPKIDMDLFSDITGILPNFKAKSYSKSISENWVTKVALFKLSSDPKIFFLSKQCPTNHDVNNLIPKLLKKFDLLHNSQKDDYVTQLLGTSGQEFIREVQMLRTKPDHNLACLDQSIIKNQSENRENFTNYLSNKRTDMLQYTSDISGKFDEGLQLTHQYSLQNLVENLTDFMSHDSHKIFTSSEVSSGFFELTRRQFESLFPGNAAQNPIISDTIKYIQQEYMFAAYMPDSVQKTDIYARIDINTLIENIKKYHDDFQDSIQHADDKIFKCDLFGNYNYSGKTRSLLDNDFLLLKYGTSEEQKNQHNQAIQQSNLQVANMVEKQRGLFESTSKLVNKKMRLSPTLITLNYTDLEDKVRHLVQHNKESSDPAGMIKQFLDSLNVSELIENGRLYGSPYGTSIDLYSYLMHSFREQAIDDIFTSKQKQDIDEKIVNANDVLVLLDKEIQYFNDHLDEIKWENGNELANAEISHSHLDQSVKLLEESGKNYQEVATIYQQAAQHYQQAKIQHDITQESLKALIRFDDIQKQLIQKEKEFNNKNLLLEDCLLKIKNHTKTFKPDQVKHAADQLDKFTKTLHDEHVKLALEKANLQKDIEQLKSEKYKLIENNTLDESIIGQETIAHKTALLKSHKDAVDHCHENYNYHESVLNNKKQDLENMHAEFDLSFKHALEKIKFLNTKHNLHQQEKIDYQQKNPIKHLLKNLFSHSKKQVTSSETGTDASPILPHQGEKQDIGGHQRPYSSHPSTPGSSHSSSDPILPIASKKYKDQEIDLPFPDGHDPYETPIDGKLGRIQLPPEQPSDHHDSPIARGSHPSKKYVSWESSPSPSSSPQRSPLGHFAPPASPMIPALNIAPRDHDPKAPSSYDDALQTPLGMKPLDSHYLIRYKFSNFQIRYRNNSSIYSGNLNNSDQDELFNTMKKHFDSEKEESKIAFRNNASEADYEEKAEKYSNKHGQHKHDDYLEHQVLKADLRYKDKVTKEIRENLSIEYQNNTETSHNILIKRNGDIKAQSETNNAFKMYFTEPDIDLGVAQQVVEHYSGVALSNRQKRYTMKVSNCGNNLKAALELSEQILLSMQNTPLKESPNFNITFDKETLHTLQEALNKKNEPNSLLKNLDIQAKELPHFLEVLEHISPYVTVHTNKLTTGFNSPSSR